MKSKHFENCSAPFCQDCKTTDAIWYAGEEVCMKKPYTKLQQRQLRINSNLKRFKDRSWTEQELTRSTL